MYLSARFFIMEKMITLFRKKYRTIPSQVDLLLNDFQIIYPSYKYSLGIDVVVETKPLDKHTNQYIMSVELNGILLKFGLVDVTQVNDIEAWIHIIWYEKDAINNSETRSYMEDVVHYLERKLEEASPGAWPCRPKEDVSTCFVGRYGSMSEGCPRPLGVCCHMQMAALW